MIRISHTHTTSGNSLYRFDARRCDSVITNNTYSTYSMVGSLENRRKQAHQWAVYVRVTNWTRCYTGTSGRSQGRNMSVYCRTWLYERRRCHTQRGYVSSIRGHRLMDPRM